MQLLNKLSEILHKFVISIFFFFRIVILTAASDSKPISNFNHLHQRSFLRKSRSQMFFKIGVSKNFGKSHRKTPVLESLFNKVAGLRFVTLLKKPPTQVFSCEICETFKNTYFHRILPVAASDFLGNSLIFKKSVFYESLSLKLPVTFPEKFLWKYFSMFY